MKKDQDITSYDSDLKDTMHENDSRFSQIATMIDRLNQLNDEQQQKIEELDAHLSTTRENLKIAQNFIHREQLDIYDLQWTLSLIRLTLVVLILLFVGFVSWYLL